MGRGGRAGQVSADDLNEAEDEFAPIVLELPEEVDLAQAAVKIEYPAAPPGTVQPADRTIRIWKKPGNQARNKASVLDDPNGDYIEPGEYLDLARLGFGETYTVTWYVEGLGPSRRLGDVRVIARLAPKAYPYGSGKYVFHDEVAITVVKGWVTPWLVTHDPPWESAYTWDHSVSPPVRFERAQHAQLMGNFAVAAFAGPPGTIDRAVLVPGEILAYYAGYISGRHVFLFRTDVNPPGDGADTDPAGTIYIEAWPIGGPGEYQVQFRLGSSVIDTAPIFIGPVMTAFNLTTKGGKRFQGPGADQLDPYEDEFQMRNYPELWPWGQQKDSWYGMQIEYRLHGTVAGLEFLFSNGPEQPGDMNGTHSLYVPEDYMLGPLEPTDPWYSYIGKWEGFDARISDERLDRVYMREVEVEKGPNPDPPPGQPLRDVASWYIVRCGEYRLDVDMVLDSDLTQEQRYRVDFQVSYRPE